MIGLLLISLALVGGFIFVILDANLDNEKKSETHCQSKDFPNLSYDQLLRCYERCNQYFSVFWKQDCRDQIKPYLWGYLRE